MIATLEPSATITPDQVEGYLLQHPDFFEDHLSLLEKLHVPHPSGKAVSLLSKQLELYRHRYNEMESRLNGLIEIGKENDISSKRMHELNLAMLEAENIDDVLTNLKQVLTDRFLADFVALRIIRERTEDHLNELYVAPDDKVLTHFHQITRSHQPDCRRPTIAQAKFLFAEAAMEVKSCAIVPMMFTDIEGFIAIGSREEGRYHQSMGSLFLVQMSEIIGTRLISLLKQP